MASNIDMDEVLQTVVSSAPQSIGDFGAMMLPISRDKQEYVSKAISYFAYQVMVDIFDVASSQGFQFNAIGFKLKQMEKMLEELDKKVNKLLMADMETSKNRLRHAMNYLGEEDTFHLAYDEFKAILSLAEKAYPKVEEFKDKVFCKQIAIFSRVMRDTYNINTKQFVALYDESEGKKRIIANSVYIDVQDALRDFHAIEIPWSKKILGKGEKEKENNQDILDSLLKASLPVIWNYQDVFHGTDEDKINQFVPEGANDAAAVTMKNGTRVMVWKTRNGSRTFRFQWCPCNLHVNAINSSLSSEFRIINDDTFSSEVLGSIKYKYKDETFNDLKSCLKHLNNEHNPEDNQRDVVVQFNDIEDIKYLQMFEDGTTIRFDGKWHFDFLKTFNSIKELKESLENIPENVRLFAQDKDGSLIVHDLLWFHKQWCSREVIGLCLNEKNSKMKNNCLVTPLHFACWTNSLEIVKLVVEAGGLVETKSSSGNLPSDLTDNKDIKEFLKNKDVMNKSS